MRICNFEYQHPFSIHVSCQTEIDEVHVYRSEDLRGNAAHEGDLLPVRMEKKIVRNGMLDYLPNKTDTCQCESPTPVAALSAIAPKPLAAISS